MENRQLSVALVGTAVALFASPLYLYRQVTCEICIATGGHIIMLYFLGVILLTSGYGYAYVAQPPTIGYLLLTISTLTIVAGFVDRHIGVITGLMAGAIGFFALLKLDLGPGLFPANR